MSGVVGTGVIAQVGFIVKDIETTKRKWAEFLGIEVPPTVGCGDYEVTQTEYKGQPAKNAECVMAFMDIAPGVQLELIQPNEEPSVWRDFLNEKGEGMHHLAFNVQGMSEKITACENFGMRLEQRGEYGDASGRYAYLSAYDDLKLLVELLESGPKQ